MKAQRCRTGVGRMAWLVVLALVLATWMASTPVRADGTYIAFPDQVVDSTDSTHGCVVPDTLIVTEDSQSGTVSTIIWELWGLLF